MNEYINIGKIVATFGVGGEVILLHALGKKTSLKGIEALFIEERKGSYLPWFIEASKAKTDDEMFVKLEGVATKESAHRLIQKQVWLLQDDFRKVVGKSSPIALLGFELMNEDESLGAIEEVIEQPHQVLLKISLNGKEALIPLHDETMNKIDQKNKRVYVTLPDGLLDVYR